jgi:peptide deformylase
MCQEQWPVREVESKIDEESKQIQNRRSVTFEHKLLKVGFCDFGQDTVGLAAVKIGQGKRLIDRFGL